MAKADFIQFERLHKATGWGLIPLSGKRPIEREWQRWCVEKRPFDPKDFRGRNAGIPCGPANGLIVLDVDDVIKFNQVREEKGWELPKTRTHKTGGGTFHYFYKYPRNGKQYGCRSFKNWGFDIRGLGGQVVAPGSVHPDTGRLYEVLYDEPIAPAPQWLFALALDDAKEQPKAQHARTYIDLDALPLSLPVKRLIRDGTPKGERSEAIFSVIQHLVKAKVPSDVIVAIFQEHKIGEKFREKGQARERWLRGEIKRAEAKLKEMSTRVTAKLDAFLAEVGPDFIFDHQKLYQELGIHNERARSALRVALHRRVKEGRIKRLNNRAGWFQVVDQELKPMNLRPRNVECLDLRLPLEEHTLVKFHPGNIILVAGDPNSGKTAYALSAGRQNLRKWSVHYFSSEMGEEELIERLSFFPNWPWGHPNFHAYERSADFASVLRRNKGDLNIIDYLEISDSFYQISGYLNEIHNALGEALALVMVQKANPHTDLPLGGYRGLEKPRLVVILTHGSAKIKKAKNWKDPQRNPNGLERKFRLIHGYRFLPEGGWSKKP